MIIYSKSKNITTYIYKTLQIRFNINYIEDKLSAVRVDTAGDTYSELAVCVISGGVIG